MKDNRITNHPVLGKSEPRNRVTFTFDGQTYHGYEGDTIASALLANRVRRFRVHEETGAPRGFYCNIGHCFECRVTVNDASGVRACLTPIQTDMIVESGKVQPDPLKSEDGASNLPRTYAEYTKSIQGNVGDPHV